jgi:hypothetical protein
LIYFPPISRRVERSMSDCSPYYSVDIDPSSSSFSLVIGQGSSIQIGVKTRDESHVSNAAAISSANRRGGLESNFKVPDSFSNWRNEGVIRQSASATMIEFLPLPV